MTVETEMVFSYCTFIIQVRFMQKYCYFLLTEYDDPIHTVQKKVFNENRFSLIELLSYVRLNYWYKKDDNIFWNIKA